MRSKTLVSLLLLVLAPPATAQLAASPGFQLTDLSFESATGGMVSPNFVAHVALGEIQSDAAMSSPGFTAEVGFLAAHDPDPGLAPEVFSVGPFSGPREGGTLLTIRGSNFTKTGGGPSTQVLIGGMPATGVVLQSDTELSCVTTAGPMGLADVVVSNAHGAAAAGNAFVYHPAVLASANAPVGGQHVVRNFGEPGALCAMSYGLTETFIPLGAWGTLLIGPAPTFQILNGVAYPVGGEIKTVYPIPEDATLAGFTIFFQSVEIVVGPTLGITFTNSDEMLIL